MAKVYKAGMFKMRVNGLPALKKAYKAQIELIRNDIKEEIDVQTRRLLADARDMASGSPQPSGSFVRDGEAGAGTGLEMFPLGSRGVIAERSGRLKSSIESSVSDTSLHGGYVLGEVGFSKAYRPPRGALKATQNNTINWPERPETGTIIVGKKAGKGPIYEPEGDDPHDYIPEILLGTDIIIGRNIFRQALVEAIQDNRVVKGIADRLKRRFK